MSRTVGTYIQVLGSNGAPARPVQPQRHPSKFAPINWASFRPLLAAMIEARDSALVIGEATAMLAPNDPPHANALIVLRASAEYILELLRCLDTRPQGKGGWQRVAKLDALAEQVEAALDAG